MFGRLLAAGAALFVSTHIAAAQGAANWPQRPVTLIVSQAAGASPDVMARLIAEKLGKELGQGVVVENKPGGGNVIGALAAARAAPDGYTYFFATSAALANNVFMMKDLPYHPTKDFAPVALVTRSNQVIVTTPDLPAKTLTELIALEKAAPGKYSLGVDGPRNLAGVTAQALNKRTGTTFVLVPYPNINNAVQDTIAGRLQVGVFSVSIVEAQIRAGSMRAIAMASAKRVSAFPDLPAAGETVPGFDFAGWFMLMAPTGTPPDIVAKMNAATDRATRDEQVREMAPKLGFDINPQGVGSPGDAANFLGEQLALWEKTTKELGIEPQ
ncbi:tripartite tricarboxylate transporter substrate binding protein [Methylocella sp. CPCC 101449]|jgi:tripartite-type tricarboxylate transporter receptor subunit TctC|uniref:Bug family tripartite tricarboxylate transporter substrate binding protein n=1 Tax=Methylocella sp. CPCC 101449 TaxID=2987531 RepID=UPI00289072A8|nr:tripartite tricarboxylate transporter substrate binding protein [Methylocella sp. CPCC 101449]MDT2023816.1 tripartite tricarboxylate transporter substrate binding protein [Methylocella sp. CPCC 101449]HEV2573642.1 tripartite tricarboxylate transporter substrate binding protein [Beijerinckiaceae bacterium]